MANGRKLADLEEQILLRSIIDLESRVFPSRVRVVEARINRLLARRTRIRVLNVVVPTKTMTMDLIAVWAADIHKRAVPPHSGFNDLLSD